MINWDANSCSGEMSSFWEAAFNQHEMRKQVAGQDLVLPKG
jgi:hypothetical protein